MTTDSTPVPVPAPHAPAATASDAGFDFEEAITAPMQLDLVELDLALDLSDIAEHGFGQAVRLAARTVGGEFLFDLPASGLIENAQRIALVCLSREEGGRFGLVLLSADGDRVRTVEADEDTMGLVQFARAFVAVLEKL
tara:strand:+ start:719 stop:1135 length:417 start_codon:yes stop_codon:yes gene_type:complete